MAYDLGIWAKRQVLQIEDLSKQQVLLELQDVMRGHNYSWHSINALLQARFEEKKLEFSLVNGNVLYEWNNLCDEKRLWEKKGHFSVNNSEFNVDCLINLKILPVQAGLGIEVIHLVNNNFDEPTVSARDLWAGPSDPEMPMYHTASWFLAHYETLSIESDDSEYVDEEDKTDDEGDKCKDKNLISADEVDAEEVDLVGIKNEDSDESECCSEEFLELEERTKDEYGEGSRDGETVDLDDLEISDLEL